MKNDNSTVKKKKSTFIKDIIRDRYLYLLLLPGVIFFVIFRYIPIYGVSIAFKDFSIFSGVSNSPWVGLDNFRKLFGMRTWSDVFWNTVKISGINLIVGFPIPIILTLMLNEIRHQKFKKFTQAILYLPYFLSWVIMAGLITAFLDPITGPIGQLISYIAGEPVRVVTSSTLFVPMLVISNIYKNMGFNTIIYLAAISTIDPTQYEAARMDGATRLKQMWHITLPALKPTIIVLFILNLNNVLNAGFDQIFNLYNPQVYEVADIIDTYVYRTGILGADYSLGAAAGFFKSIVALMFIVSGNFIASKVSETSLF